MIKAILFLALFGAVSALNACTGDCLTCHPNLVPTIKSDARHMPMTGCIKCHSAEPNSMAECGSDCFSCHPVEKIESVGVKEHEVIRGCRDCHVKLKETVSDIATPKDQSTIPTLKEILLAPEGQGEAAPF